MCGKRRASSVFKLETTENITNAPLIRMARIFRPFRGGSVPPIMPEANVSTVSPSGPTGNLLCALGAGRPARDLEPASPARWFRVVFCPSAHFSGIRLGGLHGAIKATVVRAWEPAAAPWLVTGPSTPASASGWQSIVAGAPMSWAAGFPRKPWQ